MRAHVNETRIRVAGRVRNKHANRASDRLSAPTDGFALLQTLCEEDLPLPRAHFPQLLQAPLLHLHLLPQSVALHLQRAGERLEPHVFAAESTALLHETLAHLPRATVEVLNQALEQRVLVAPQTRIRKMRSQTGLWKQKIFKTFDKRENFRLRNKQ